MAKIDRRIKPGSSVSFLKGTIKPWCDLPEEQMTGTVISFHYALRQNGKTTFVTVYTEDGCTNLAPIVHLSFLRDLTVEELLTHDVSALKELALKKENNEHQRA